MKTAMKPTDKRPYQKHGLTTLQSALKSASADSEWIDKLGPVGAELREWRTTIISDLGGAEAVSAMEMSIVNLSCQTYVMLSSIDHFLIQQPSLINKSKRALYPVVLQRQVLAESLARSLSQLGLKRRAKPVTSLADLLAGRTGQPEAREGTL